MLASGNSCTVLTDTAALAAALHRLNIWWRNDMTNFINTLLSRFQSRSEKLFLLRSKSKASDPTYLFIHHFQPITYGHFLCKSPPLAPRSLANTPYFCMLDVWGLTEMTDVWIYEKLLARICIKVLDLLTKMYFAIQSVFISTYHFQSPVFPLWHSSAKSLQSLQPDNHSFNSVRFIMAQELYIDSLMLCASQVTLILCLASS